VAPAKTADGGEAGEAHAGGDRHLVEGGSAGGLIVSEGEKGW
jgi:hypothetical protein